LPERFIHGLHFRNLKGDIYGGITAAVVALPLALAFGVASGAGPVAGMYGAIFVGFFAALFGGTPSQVSGPTGPMTVVTAALITQYAHEPALAFTVVMMAGGFQILFGTLRLGRYINLVPYPVVSGFMSGIGCIIIFLQLAPFVGRENPAGGPLQALAALPQAFAHPVVDALVVGVVSLVIVVLMPARLRRYAPPPLAALAIGTVLAAWQFRGAPILGDIPSGFPDPQLPALELKALPGMVKSALVLAFLGSIDSLLTSLVCDSMTNTPHRSDRELVGQGIGNAIAGLMGAIPGAGATMRSVINIRSGGQTPLSGMLHALVLLAVMLGLGTYARYIPHAVLAGILLKVGIDIIDWDYLRRVPSAPRAGVLFMFTVMGLTVFVDLITAVAVGVVMASLLFVKRMADLQAESMRAVMGEDDEVPLDETERLVLAGAAGRIVLYHMSGPLSFGGASELARRLDALGMYRVLVLDLAGVPYIDSSAALAIEGLVRRAREHDRHVILVGLKGPVARVLTQLGVLRMLGPRGRFRSRERALLHAQSIIAPPASAA
jgi:SulP family sulfate permease